MEVHDGGGSGGVTRGGEGREKETAAAAKAGRGGLGRAGGEFFYFLTPFNLKF
jgi:hypothetical protein